MNYDLAIMALEGLTRSPLRIELIDGGVQISAASAGFKELARLCLILGGEGVSAGEEFQLNPAMHVSAESQALSLRLR